jgi:hypothetical protein
MTKSKIFRLIGGGCALAMAGTSGAQMTGGGAPAAPLGGPRVQDVAAANRQFDNDYNILASRGVKVTNKSRDHDAIAAKSKRGSIAPATAVDMKAGTQVRDIKGVPVGTIAAADPNVAVDPGQAVVDTGETKIAVPLEAFGKDDKGLLLSVTADKFHQLVAQARTGNSSPPTQSN